MSSGVGVQINYSASPTARRFHRSDVRNRGILGPIGSGKSSVCVLEIFIRGMKQEPSPDGVRRTRWAVVRNTYNELVSTTIKTFRDWFAEPLCKYRAANPLGARIYLPLSDGTVMDCEIIFLACDRVEDAGKFRSLELTGAWVNEASEIRDIEIVNQLYGRCGRYPRRWGCRETGDRIGGATWYGLIADTNAPDDEHWWHRLAEVERPSNWEFFTQPPAVLLAAGSTPDRPVYVPNDGQRDGIPRAENVENISAGWDYYMDQTIGKPYEYIKVFLMAQYGTIAYGKPVYTEYNAQYHFAPNRTDGKGEKEVLRVHGGLPLLLGWDFGVRNSAVVVAQLTYKGQLRVLEEILGEDIGVRQFARDVVYPKLKNDYPAVRWISVGDPAGSSRSATDERTCIQILNEEGIRTTPCHTNSPMARIEAVRYFLNRNVDGKPGLVVGEKCPTLHRGFMGRYSFKLVSSLTRGEDYTGEVLKNLYSHPHDALQYIAVTLLSNPNTAQSARQPIDNSTYDGIGFPQETSALPKNMDMAGYF